MIEKIRKKYSEKMSLFSTSPSKSRRGKLNIERGAGAYFQTFGSKEGVGLYMDSVLYTVLYGTRDGLWYTFPDDRPN